MKQRRLAKFLAELGPSKAVERFITQYGSLNTRETYAAHLALYLRWLRSKGINMSPDELIHDNLISVYKSEPTDISTKRKHTDLLHEYINIYLLETGASEAKRKLAAAAIRRFYQANDSPLFGAFRIASQLPELPPKPLSAEDIRAVLKALPLKYRTPLLIMWQSGLEPSRVLNMKFPLNQEPPAKIEIFWGRKRHRRPYFTFIGRDSVEHLRMLGAIKFPDYQSLRLTFKACAMRLAARGLIENKDPRAWHPYALRHSFKTEAEHAGAKTQVVEFFMGHISSIQWVYDHRGELHEEDFRHEYLKIEPHVSLSPGEAVIRARYESREAQLLKEILELRRLYDELKREVLRSA